MDGIFYQLKNGCNWEDLRPYSTVYWYYRRWRADGQMLEWRDALKLLFLKDIATAKVIRKFPVPRSLKTITMMMS